MYLHTPGEVDDSFNTNCSVLTATATCQMWWKFVISFQSYSKKTFCLLLWFICLI